jgi:hypothetical protein
MDRQLMNSSDEPRKRRPANPGVPAIEDAVGQRLRSYYAEISEQEVPKQFLDLLEALDQAGPLEKSKPAKE